MYVYAKVSVKSNQLTAYNSAVFVTTRNGDDRVVLDEEMTRLVVSEV